MKDFKSINDLELLKRVTGAKLNALNQEIQRLKSELAESESKLADSEQRFNDLLEDKLTDQEKRRYFEKTFKKV